MKRRSNPDRIGGSLAGEAGNNETACFCNIVYLCFCFFFFLLSLISPSFAIEKNIAINAENISYDKKLDVYEASGSAEVLYKDITVYGQHLLYDVKQGKVKADNGFTLLYGGITFEGQSLDYDLDDRAGTASKVSFTFKQVYLKGEKISLSAEELRLNNAYFTTCDLALPRNQLKQPGPAHYSLTASEIMLYPEYGWLIAYWGYFWVNNIPVVPVPTYIYDVYAEQKGQKNLPPFPEVTSNNDDGLMFNERLAWYLNRKLSGSYSLSYATNKGIGVGLDANYSLDRQNYGNARMLFNFTDGPVGGITHHYFYGAPLAKEAEKSLQLLNLPDYRQFELESTLSYRERINYQRITYYPNLYWRWRGIKFPDLPIQFEGELNSSALREDSTTHLFRGGGKVRFSMDFSTKLLDSLVPSLSSDDRFYSDGSRWLRTDLALDLLKKFNPYTWFTLGYWHYLQIEGQSPFNFENYHYRPADKLLSGLHFVVGETGAEVKTAYFLDNWQPEDIDYSLFFRLHCYNLITTYRSLRNELTVGVGLAAGE